AALLKTAIDVATCFFSSAGTLYSIPSSEIIYRIKRTAVSTVGSAKLTTIIETIEVATSLGINRHSPSVPATTPTQSSTTPLTAVKLLYVAKNSSFDAKNVNTAIIEINAKIPTPTAPK